MPSAEPLKGSDAAALVKTDEENKKPVAASRQADGGVEAEPTRY